jgi:hypothetical protein
MGSNYMNKHISKFVILNSKTDLPKDNDAKKVELKKIETKNPE